MPGTLHAFSKNTTLNAGIVQKGAVYDIVALNASVSGSGANVGRVAGWFRTPMPGVDTPSENQWARGNMRINGSVIDASDSDAVHNRKHGISLGLGTLSNAVFMELLANAWWLRPFNSTTPSLGGPGFSISTSSTGSTVWQWHAINTWASHRLPTLRGMPGNPTQNPQLQ